MSDSEDWMPNVEQVGSDQNQSMGYVRSLMREGKIDEARAELQRIIEAEPDNTQALMAYGMSMQAERRFEEASDLYERVMEIEPDNIAGPMLAASVGVQGDNSEYAEANYHKALAITPTSMPALMGLARLHMSNEKSEAALEVLERAIEIDPQSGMIRRQLARILSNLDRPDEARAHLQHMLTVRPGDQPSTLLLAYMYNEEGQSDKAMMVLEDAINIHPEDPRLKIAVARSKLEQNDYEGAEAVLRRVISGGEMAGQGQRPRIGGWRPGQFMRRRPNWGAQLTLVQALVPQGKLKEAREILGKAPRNKATAPLVQRLYADTFAAEGNYDAAEQSYRAAVLGLKHGEEVLQSIDDEKAAEANMTADKLVALYTDKYDDALRQQAREFDPSDFEDVARRLFRFMGEAARTRAEQRAQGEGRGGFGGWRGMGGGRGFNM